MRNRKSKQIDTHSSGRKLGEDFRALSHRILHYANRGLPRIDFAREVSKMLIDFSECDVVELRLKRHDKYYLCQAKRDTKQSFRFEPLPCSQTEDGRMIPCSQDDSAMETLCRDIILGHIDRSLPFFTKKGGFWTGDAGNTPITRPATDNRRLKASTSAVIIDRLSSSRSWWIRTILGFCN